MKNHLQYMISAQCWQMKSYNRFALVMFFIMSATIVIAQVKPAPDRTTGEGPFDRLIIRGATLIDGSGAPPTGPVDIVIEKNRIVDIKVVGVPYVEIDPEKRPADATKEIDATGKYVMPGIVDLHVHTGGDTKAPEAEYVYKLWLANGITTVRGVPTGPLEWSLSERDRSAKNKIAAPRIISFHVPGQGKEWEDRKILTPADAKEWVQYAHKKGVDGLKLRAYRPEIMKALLDEAKALGMGSTAHLGTIWRSTNERSGCCDDWGLQGNDSLLWFV